jgi:hypothetical protein
MLEYCQSHLVCVAKMSTCVIGPVTLVEKKEHQYEYYYMTSMF